MKKALIHLDLKWDFRYVIMEDVWMLKEVQKQTAGEFMPSYKLEIHI